MLAMRHRIAIIVIVALGAAMLLHAHSGLESASVHCNVCIQQSHGIVEHTVAVVEDDQVRLYEPSIGATAADLVVSLHVGSRAPPA